jgi:peptide/nickel transport system substrate-binding protein
MRKTIVLINILLVLALLFAACTTPTDEPAVVDEPTVEEGEEVVVEPTEEEEDEGLVMEEQVAVAEEEEEVEVALFNEAPMLADKVAAGELPPVDERLPDQPRVVPVLKEIGQYGGELRHGITGGSPSWGGMLYVVGWEHLVSWKADFSGVVPNLVKAIEANEDASEYTFFMREGMKWSDGEPFTADDIAFYIEDVLMNEDLYPAGFSADWCPGSMNDDFRFEKIDDYTFKFIFPESYGTLLFNLAAWQGRQFAMYPKHYLEQWHKDYNPNIDDLIAAEEGVEDWSQLFFKYGPDSWGNPDRAFFEFPEFPTLNAWRVVEPLSLGTTVKLERNPYYWKVDAEGNQLPYVDTMLGVAFQDGESQLLAMLNGDLDALKDPGDENRALYYDALAAGKPLQISRGLPDGANGLSLQFNMTHPDPVKREVFSDINFRIGISHAINREEYIELFNNGMGYPAQMCPQPTSPLAIERCNSQYIEYDLDLANEYLDKVLPDRDAEGWRLGPDGLRFQPQLFVVTTWSWAADQAKRGEVIVEYMRAVGIDAKLNAMSDDQFNETARLTNLVEGFMSTGEGGAGLLALIDPRNFVPGMDMHAAYGMGWWLYIYEVANATGAVEPPDWVLDAQAKYHLAVAQPTQELQIQVMREVIEEATDNFYVIGAWQGGEGYWPWHSRVGNTPDEWYIGWIEGVQKITYPEQWYLKQ